MEPADLSPRARLAIGAVLCAAGVVLGAYGFLDGSELKPDRFIAAPIALALVSAGAGFGVMTSWIAFGPGERHFTGSIGFGGIVVEALQAARRARRLNRDPRRHADCGTRRFTPLQEAFHDA